MHHIYVDESIHVRGKFIVVATVVTNGCINAAVDELLSACGFRPGVDEFKSSMLMADNKSARGLREGIRGILLEHCNIAVAVIALAERTNIMAITTQLISNLVQDISRDPAVIFFDEGISSVDLDIPDGWTIKPNCDSKLVGGVQLADCAAHTLATMLLAELGLVDKTVKTYGRYPEPEVELAWELWFDLRHSLASDKPVFGLGKNGLCEPLMYSHGLLISDACAQEVKDAAQLRFGEIWLGCIH